MRRVLAIGSRSLAGSRRRTWVATIVGVVVLLAVDAPPGWAQQPVQPPPVPQEIEKRFETIQQNRGKHAAPALPGLPKSAAPAPDTKPWFKLNGIAIVGARTIPADAIAASYRPYIGKTVSQADLAAIVEAISDLYRNAGYHLSRAIVPPQDIKDGHIVIVVVEGAITELVLKGDGAEEFGIRALLAPVLEESPSRLTTLERQLLLVNDRPGVRILDNALEEIGNTTGKFRLIVTVETWHVYAAQSIDSLGQAAVGPLEAYLSSAFNSGLVAGDSIGFNYSTTPSDLHELQFGRVTYDAPIGGDGARVGLSALYNDVRPGDLRQFFDTRTLTEGAELRGSIVPLETRSQSLVLTAAAPQRGLRPRYDRVQHLQ
jgi:hemolysin activation/secretion protein